MTTARKDWLNGRGTRSRRRGITFLGVLILSITTLGVFLQIFTTLPGLKPLTAHASSPTEVAPALAPMPDCGFTCQLERFANAGPCIGRCGKPPPLQPKPDNYCDDLCQWNEEVRRDQAEIWSDWPPPRQQRSQPSGGGQWADGWCGPVTRC